MKKQLFYIFAVFILTASAFAQENEFLKRGKEFLAAEKLAEANKEFSNCVLKTKETAVLSECYLLRSETLTTGLKKLADINSAIKLTPTNGKAFFYRARHFYRDEQNAKALPDFNKAIALDANNFEAFYLRGIVFGEMKDKQKPVEDFTTVIKLKPDYANAYLMRAYAYNDLGKYDSAIEDFNKYFELDPKSDEAIFQRGKTFQAKGDKEKAAADIRKAIEMQPDIPPYKEALANMNLSKEEVVKKAQEIQEKENPYRVLEFLDDYPEFAEDTEILYLKSVASVEAGYFKEADVYFQKQFDAFYKDALSSIEAGDEYAAKPKSEENSAMASLMYGTAMLALASADLVNSLRAVATEKNGLPAAKRNPKNLNGYAEFSKIYEETAVKAGNVELSADKFDLALENFNKALEINPRSKSALENRAKVYRKQGKLRLAQTDEAKAKLLTAKK
ncbi:MAG TPA: tetratricopeptide repeat protein [Pyrinomonadaceae bacterium]|nr:tetratricopeptide repeat protein [Pyrinomonadaceae bacterium]